jgi:hypothetical protein
MTRSHRTQLFVRERVSGQHRASQLEWIEDGENIAIQAIRRIRGRRKRRRAGSAKSAPRNAVDMMRRRQFGRELVEYVGRVSQTRQQNQWPSRATPVEHLQLDWLIEVLSTLMNWIVCGAGSFDIVSGIARRNTSGNGRVCDQVPSAAAPSALSVPS